MLRWIFTLTNRDSNVIEIVGEKMYKTFGSKQVAVGSIYNYDLGHTRITSDVLDLL